MVEAGASAVANPAAETANFDVAICGAGPVGQALALMLLQRGLPAQRIALIDAKSVEQAGRDARSIALSYGSRQLLDGLGAWPAASTAIREIHVSRRGHFGRSLIACEEYGLPALGYVVRYGDLVQPLHRALSGSGIALMRPVQVDAIEERDAGVSLRLADGSADAKTITAAFVVQAEGGTFDEQQAKAHRRDYAQTAVISHIRCSAPLAQRAFERFTEQGPLALLPQDEGYALVWCVRPDAAEHLLQLGDEAFLHALQQAFGDRLGRILEAGKRAAFPLGLNAQAHASARTVAIGNAAQTLHPVAGQGLNLGLRDAAVLAKVLTAAMPSLPEADALQQFVRRRATDRSSMIRLTDGMARAFASTPDGSLTQTLLGAGLGVLDLLAPAKKALAEQMMFGWR